MDAYELLQATQKAIGDAHLYDQHKQLIDKREVAKTKGTVRAVWCCWVYQHACFVLLRLVWSRALGSG